MSTQWNLNVALSGTSDEGFVNRWPVDVDQNMVTGQKSIARHSARLSCREYVGCGRARDPRYVFQETRGPWCFIVMSSGCSEEDRHAPAVVKEADAKLLVDLLMLPPAADRHESFLSARGLLREGHLSWTKFTSPLVGKLA